MKQEEARAAASRTDGSERAAVFHACAAAQINSFAEALLQVREEAVIVARGVSAGKIAALVLIIVAEYQSAAAIRKRSLIASDFSLGQIQRVGWAEERVAGH